MLAPVALGGAKQRLLPERIPALFFGTAVLAHIIAWAALIIIAPEWPWYAGGPGPVLAAIHVLTLGVLLCTAIGASLQMLPVILARPAAGEKICLGIFWSLTAGAGLLVAGFAATDATVIVGGALFLLVAILLYGRELRRLLSADGGALLLQRYVAAALLSLGAAVILAFALAANYALGVLPDHGRLAVAHATLAAFGFMGMLALGLSQVLVPMFAIAEPPPDAPLAVAFRLAASALALAVAGELSGLPFITAAASLLGLGAAAAHIRAMMRTVAGRMRRRLGPEFVLIFVSWASLPLGLLIAGLLSLDLLPAQGAALLIVVVLYGWLLSLLTGVLQRVLPFLASMQVARLKARPLAPTKLVTETPLKVHLLGHLAGVAALIGGTLLAVPGLIATAGAIGAVGACAFAWFAVTVLLRTRAHLKAYPAGWKGTIG
jgi:hypothetical protein